MKRKTKIDSISYKLSKSGLVHGLFRQQIIVIIISTIFIQDSLFSKDITAITKGPVKIKVCEVKEKRSK